MILNIPHARLKLKFYFVDKGQPTDVSVNMYLISLTAISDANMVSHT